MPERFEAARDACVCGGAAGAHISELEIGGLGGSGRQHEEQRGRDRRKRAAQAKRDEDVDKREQHGDEDQPCADIDRRRGFGGGVKALCADGREAESGAERAREVDDPACVTAAIETGR